MDKCRGVLLDTEQSCNYQLQQTPQEKISYHRSVANKLAPVTENPSMLNFGVAHQYVCKVASMTISFGVLLTTINITLFLSSHTLTLDLID